MPSPQPIAPAAGVRFDNITDPKSLQNQPLQNENEETSLCHRKPKHHLTMIPEDEKPISYRFHVVLAGAKAHEFAQAAVDSEFALEHMQRNPRPSPSVGSTASKASVGDDDPDEEFVFFCPNDDGELARLRLSTCTGFSQHLPLSRDRATARNIVVVLLWWHVAAEEEATEDAINDFRTRLAEIIHTPVHCRPYTTLLAFGASDEQRAELDNLVGNQKTIKVDLSFYEEDTEDCVIDSLKKVCAGTMAHLSVTYERSLASKGGALMSTTSPSCGCAAM